MSETIVHKGKWVMKESEGDYFWYYDSTCIKCGTHVFIPLDSPRLATLLCATCYYDSKNLANERMNQK